MKWSLKFDQTTRFINAESCCTKSMFLSAEPTYPSIWVIKFYKWKSPFFNWGTFGFEKYTQCQQILKIVWKFRQKQFNPLWLEVVDGWANRSMIYLLTKAHFLKDMGMGFTHGWRL